MAGVGRLHGPTGALEERRFAWVFGVLRGAAAGRGSGYFPVGGAAIGGGKRVFRWLTGPSPRPNAPAGRSSGTYSITDLALTASSDFKARRGADSDSRGTSRNPKRPT
jgi:hypothetical protein